MFRVLVVAAVVCGLLDSPGKGKPAPPDYGPLPGDSLARFEGFRGKLVKTGAAVAPRMRPGFSFEVWEDHRGREYTFSGTFLPCDPTDTKGAVYVPKTVLLVQRSPDGSKVVVGEKRSTLVKTDAEVDKRIAEEEKFVAAHQEPAKGFPDRMRNWWRRSVTREPYMQYVFDDGRIVIGKGEAWLPRYGALVTLVLAPYFEGADLSGTAAGNEGETEGKPPEDGEPTPSATPIASDSLRAPLKHIRYLKPYEGMMLEDLASYIDDKRKKPRRRPLYSR
ncbi:MAG: hypothetical protein FJZ01_23575 [Candidatus Sericytochromatia bacterium]|nr:hypothetical protein [Candidatus Tanganyikabacteria bacterium]